MYKIARDRLLATPTARFLHLTMHDLRKQALLESGKTVSRKARSKEATPPTSRPGSRAHSSVPSPQSSRVASRQGSDDEDEFSDGTEWSTNSIDALVSPQETDNEITDDIWASDLSDRINAIVDRKRSSTEGREQQMSGLVTILTRHYSGEGLRSKVDELLPALLKSVKSGQSERELVLALKALAMVIITLPSDHIYEAVAQYMKTTVSDSSYASAKVAAIHALAIATFYGGASEDETASVMDSFLAIAASDGATIDEADNGKVVVAALEEWGFLAIELENIEDVLEEAMDTFVDQLDSNDAGVQIAAGNNIALLFETSYTQAVSDDEQADEDEEDADGNRMVKRFTVYRQTYQLKMKLEALAKASSKWISKKDRKQLHLQFNDVLSTMEKPTRGPRYSTAIDIEGRERGSRMKITIHGGGKMTIDKWWKLHRLEGLKRLLQSGFMVHYEANEAVFESLPVIVEE